MKKIYALLFFVLIQSGAFAGAKTYQVTGPIVDITDTTIVVMKGKDKWEIDKSAATKVNGELKKGSKVTIVYTMTASDIEVKK